LRHLDFTETFTAGMVLACVGLYGVTAYSIVRRTNEIGIRIALGASRASVLGSVLKTALAQVFLGLAIGVPLVLAGGSILASLLYGIKGTDPVILGAAVAILVGCAVIAALFPALRATKIDPVAALRCE
jgi:ABC-type antimicrobial peptide transport system permease subunit